MGVWTEAQRTLSPRLSHPPPPVAQSAYTGPGKAGNGEELGRNRMRANEVNWSSLVLYFSRHLNKTL